MEHFCIMCVFADAVFGCKISLLRNYTSRARCEGQRNGHCKKHRGSSSNIALQYHMPFFVDNCHGELAIPETACDLGHSSGRSSHHRTTSKSIPIMVSGIENTTVPTCLAKARALSIDMKSVAFRQQGSDAVQAPVDTAEDAELERAIHRQRSSDLRTAVACCCSKRCLLVSLSPHFTPVLRGP